jgi:hypothetical protein
MVAGAVRYEVFAVINYDFMTSKSRKFHSAKRED